MPGTIRRLTTSPIGEAANRAAIFEVVEFEPADRPTYMPGSNRQFPQVTAYDMYRSASRRFMPQRLGEVTLVRNGEGERYLTRVHIHPEFEAATARWTAAALVLAAETAQAEGEALRTDPAGEYGYMLDAWDRLIAAGIATVVDDQHFPHHDPSQIAAEPSHVYRGGHYQVLPIDMLTSIG